MTTGKLWKHLVVVFSIVLCTYLKDLPSSELLLSREAVQTASFLKAYAKSDDDDDENKLKSRSSSILSLSMGSSDQESVSSNSDKTDSNSVRSDEFATGDKKKKKFFTSGIFKSKSGSYDKDRPKDKDLGTKPKLVQMLMKKFKKTPDSSQENAGARSDDESEDGTKDLDIPTPPNPNLERLAEGDPKPYDEGIMQMYLESQVTSSDAMILKSREILNINKELFKTLKNSYSDQISDGSCNDQIMSGIFVLCNQVFTAKAYCGLASIKIDNEAGFCRNRCKLLNSKACKTCKKAFERKDKCKSISNKVDSIITTMIKILKNCVIKNTSAVVKATNLKMYRGVAPLKCKEEQYITLKGKLEAKLAILSLKVSFVNQMARLKQACSNCVKEECKTCKSVAYCPQCPGFDDITSCSNCLASQTMQSSLLLERNRVIQEVRLILNKLLSCETYLAMGEKSPAEADYPSDADFGKILEEAVNKNLSKYLSYSMTSHIHSRAEFVSGSLLEGYKKMPQELKSAILKGVPLKKPVIERPTQVKQETQLDEIYKKIKKEPGKHEDHSHVPPTQRPIQEPSPEEKNAAIILFDYGICTYLMLRLLEDELKECNSQIAETSRQHSGCENCIFDGCRKKRCNNFPEIKKLILKREEISAAIVKCNSAGFLSQNDLKAKIEELRASGVLSMPSASDEATAETGVDDKGPDLEETGIDSEEFTRL